MQAKEAYEYLTSQNLIAYGEIIPSAVIQKLIGFTPDDGWEFLGPYLQLKEHIESQGYFCTSSDCNKGGLRILPLEDMSDRVKSIQKRLFRRQKRAYNDGERRLQ